MKVNEQLTFECNNPKCLTQFTVKFEPLVKLALADLINEKNVRFCVFCGKNDLKIVENDVSRK